MAVTKVTATKPATKETTKAAVKETAKEVVKEVAKETKEVAAVAKKTADKAVKTTAKKATVAKTATKTAAKAAVKAVKAPKTEITVEFAQKSYTVEQLTKIATDVWVYDLGKKATEMKSLDLYVKPEENAAYYVVNGEITGSFAI